MGNERPRAEGRGRTLSGRLILFGTLITLVAIVSSFLVLSVTIRRQTRTHLVELLAQNQTNARDLKERSLQELLWISTLMSQSPTLRAALDTYRTEAPIDSLHRRELLATVGSEVRKIRVLMGKDLVLVTDEQGKILAGDPAIAPATAADASLASRAWIREVLDSDNPEARPVFGVATMGGDRYHVGCVPIVLQGFVIGTLTLGDRIDADWLARLHETLHSEVALVIDDEVGGATSRLGALPSDYLARLRDANGMESKSAELAMIGPEEYLTLPISMGRDDEGRHATLVLLQSLTAALQPVQRSLIVALFSCGALSVLLAGVAAWRISRSILNPLERFVSFIRSVATSRDASQRFEDGGTTTEINVLNGAFSELLASVQQHQQQMLQQQREELIRVERLKESEKLASLGRMLSSAAHEINNPLTAVLGMIDLSLVTAPADGNLRARLDSARREAQRISALVRTLLKVAHRDTGEKTMVDLHQLLRETIALRQHDYNSAGIGLTLQACADPVTLEANELELQQVFLNIINNAYDALKGREGEPALTLKTTREGGLVVVTLADNGPGMTDPGKVFDHFFTTKEIGKGTGLGLSITHAIVQSHGGVITAANRPEGGACFTVKLPAPAKVRAAARTAQTQPSVSGGPIHLTTALVVEDEPTVLEYQMDILRSLGASPVGARSGAEAVEWLLTGEFEVIVSDLKMPGGMSGSDLFDWVAKNRPDLSSRFVFVTGDSANDATREFLEQAGRPYLMKPFDVEEYVRALHQAGARRPAA